MPRWVKLSEMIAEDLTIADMLGNTTEARAALLFLMALPRADLYGVLPSPPRLFKARVCPVARIGEASIGKAIDILIERRMLTRFKSNGKAYLLATNYHKYQEVRWNNWVGPPAVQLPDDWQPPKGLLTFTKSLPVEKVCPYLHKIPTLCKLLPATTVDYCRLQTTTVLDVDVDVDVDVEADKEALSLDSSKGKEEPAHEATANDRVFSDDIFENFTAFCTGCQAHLFCQPDAQQTAELRKLWNDYLQDDLLRAIEATAEWIENGDSPPQKVKRKQRWLAYLKGCLRNASLKQWTHSSTAQLPTYDEMMAPKEANDSNH